MNIVMKNWVEFADEGNDSFVIYKTRIYSIPDGAALEEKNGKLLHEFGEALEFEVMEDAVMGRVVKDTLEKAYQKACYKARVIHAVISENNKRSKMNTQEVPNAN